MLKITRSALIRAVDAGIAAAGSEIPADAIARLHAWAASAESFGSNFDLGCPLAATGLYPDHTVPAPDWVWKFAGTFDLRMVCDHFGLAYSGASNIRVV